MNLGCYSFSMNINVKELENSEVRIDVVLEKEKIEVQREVITKKLISDLEIDGFRKGKVPVDRALKTLDPMRIYEEMAQEAIWENFAAILKESKVQAIGRPSISITKITEGSDLEFSLTTAVMPTVTLGDYQSTAKNTKIDEADLTVTQEEIDEVILNLRKMKAQSDFKQKQKDSDNPDEVAPSWNDIDEKDLPEIDDAWVTTLGAFANVDEFMEKMKDNLKEEKKAKALDKKRIALIDGILENSKITLPQMLVDYEIDKMMHEFEHSIAMTGVSFEEYLSSIQKTREDYRAAWQEQGKKRAQTELVLTEIAKVENLNPDEAKIEEEVTKIMEQYKNQTGIDENSVRSYVSSVLSHQAVFEFLESLA